MSTGGDVLHRPISDLMNYFSPNVFIFNGSAVMLTLNCAWFTVAERIVLDTQAYVTPITDNGPTGN